MLTRREVVELTYLEKNGPCWGGHVDRGQPVSDPNMQRWIDLGLIKYKPGAIMRGYVLTPAGRKALAEANAGSVRTETEMERIT